MTLKLKILKILFNCTIPLFLLTLAGCAAEPQYIIFKTGVRDQLKQRAVKHCFGDFEVLEEEEFGPYTRVRLECLE